MSKLRTLLSHVLKTLSAITGWRLRILQIMGRPLSYPRAPATIPANSSTLSFENLPRSAGFQNFA